MDDTRLRIRHLNDQLRCNHRGGTIVLTLGIQSKGAGFITKIDTALSTVKFDAGNDPYEEHDFGAVKVEGITVFFKIDYYDLDHCYGSPDPADENVTRRVMTIMLAEEY